MFCYCAQSRRLARTLTARYDAALAKAGLTAAQFETLSVLEAITPSSGRALAQHLALDKTTLSRNLKPLLEAGLIRAAQDDNDARSVLYSLTATGRRRLSRATVLWHQVHQSTLSALGKDAPAAERLLQRMVQTFG
jgi:DNA-binding MarR family transcriptional regulator